jgi:hypothetical protein
MAQPRKARAGLSAFWGIIGFSLIGILAIWYRCAATSTESNDDKRAQARLTKLTDLRKNDEKKLNGYGWIDKSKGLVSIPIERAMDLTLVDLKQKQVAASSVKAEPVPSQVVPPYVQAQSSASPAASGTTGK